MPHPGTTNKSSRSRASAFGERLLGASVSVRTRIIVFALLATLIPSAGFGLITFNNNQRLLTDSTSKELSGIANHISRELDLWFRERVYDIRVFSSSYVVQENLETYIRTLDHSKSPDTLGLHRDAASQLTNYLTLINAKFPFYSRLSVLDPSERIVAESRADIQELKLPANWLRLAAEHQTVWGLLRKNPANNHLILPVAVPVQSAIGAFLGVMVGEIDLQQMHEHLLGIASELEGDLYVVDRDGLIVSHRSAEDQTVPEAIPGFTATALFANPDTLRDYEGIGKKQVVGVLKPMQSVNWGFVIERPKAEVFASVKRLRDITLLVVCALLLVIGMIGYLLGQGIVKPLDRLVRGADRISSGDLDVNLPVYVNDELGNTTEVFNDMVKRLRQNRAQLAATNEALQRKNEELEHASITDALTGIFNRRYMMELIHRHISLFHRGKRAFAVLLIDIDHFKAINDTYGHVAGDRVLAKIAAVIRESLRAIDYAGRYGGEEFVVILVDTSSEDAERTAERIRSAVAKQQHLFDNQTIEATISVGVASYDNDRESVEGLIKRADEALYHSKHEGRDRVTVAKRTRIIAVG